MAAEHSSTREFEFKSTIHDENYLFDRIKEVVLEGLKGYTVNFILTQRGLEQKSELRLIDGLYTTAANNVRSKLYISKGTNKSHSNYMREVNKRDKILENLGPLRRADKLYLKDPTRDDTLIVSVLKDDGHTFKRFIQISISYRDEDGYITLTAKNISADDDIFNDIFDTLHQSLELIDSESAPKRPRRGGKRHKRHTKHRKHRTKRYTCRMSRRK